MMARVLPPGPEQATAPSSGAVASRRIASMLRVVLLGVAAALLLWLFSKVLLLLFFAVLLACTLRGAADDLARLTRLPGRLTLALITLVMIALAAAAFWWIGPALADQGSDLVTSLTGELDRLSKHYGSTRWGSAIEQHFSGFSPSAMQVGAPAFTVLGIALSGVGDIVLLSITALYLAVTPEIYERGVVALVAIRHRPRVLAILRQIGRTLRLWLLGQMIDMVAVGVLAAIGLWLLGVPVPLALGVLAGLLTFIPYFGAIAAGIPGVLVALTVSPTVALYTVGVFLLCHLMEGYILSPLLQRRLVELPPAVSLLSMAAAGSLFGPLGVVMGTPLAAAVMVAVREGYVVDVLGDTEAHHDNKG